MYSGLISTCHTFACTVYCVQYTCTCVNQEHKNKDTPLAALIMYCTSVNCISLMFNYVIYIIIIIIMIFFVAFLFAVGIVIYYIVICLYLYGDLAIYLVAIPKSIVTVVWYVHIYTSSLYTMHVYSTCACMCKYGL